MSDAVPSNQKCTCGEHWASVAGHAGSCPLAEQSPSNPSKTCVLIDGVIYCQCGDQSSHYGTMGERGAREVRCEAPPREQRPSNTLLTDQEKLVSDLENYCHCREGVGFKCLPCRSHDEIERLQRQWLAMKSEVQICHERIDRLHAQLGDAEFRAQGLRQQPDEPMKLQAYKVAGGAWHPNPCVPSNVYDVEVYLASDIDEARRAADEPSADLLARLTECELALHHYAPHSEYFERWELGGRAVTKSDADTSGITAQQEETGRLWQGPRNEIPKGFVEIRTSTETKGDL